LVEKNEKLTGREKKTLLCETDAERKERRREGVTD